MIVGAQSKDTDFDSILTTLADKVWHMSYKSANLRHVSPLALMGVSRAGSRPTSLLRSC